MARRGTIRACAGGVLATALLATAVADSAGPAASCSVAGAEVTVEAAPETRAFEPTRVEFFRGSFSLRAGNTAVPCEGDAATVASIDTVSIHDRTEGNAATVYYGGRAGAASFAPGLSDEGDGSSEIEASIDLGGDAGDELQIVAELKRRSPDVVELGQRGKAIAINFNAAAESNRAADADLVVRGIGGSKRVRRSYPDGALYIRMGAGSDRLDARGGGPLGKRLKQSIFVSGGGNKGGLTALLGRGDDTAIGSDGRDKVKAGKGHDLVETLSGNDRVNVADGIRDNVDCGAGRDFVIADRQDKLKNCERRRLK